MPPSAVSVSVSVDGVASERTPGGVIVFDEWNYDAWPGSTLAIKEFCDAHPEAVQTCTDREQPAFFIRKLPASVTRAA